jgi:hypothetical protein
MSTGIKNAVINGETHDVKFFPHKAPGFLCPRIQTMMTRKKNLFPVGCDTVDMF